MARISDFFFFQKNRKLENFFFEGMQVREDWLV